MGEQKTKEKQRKKFKRLSGVLWGGGGGGGVIIKENTVAFKQLIIFIVNLQNYSVLEFC